jgi:hypothetical protein
MKFRRKFLREFYEPIISNLYQSAELEDAALRSRIQNVILEEWHKIQGVGKKNER